MYFERLHKYLGLQSQCDGDKTCFMKQMQRYMPLLPKSKSILFIRDSQVEYGIDFGPDGWINTIQGNLGLQSVINRGASGYNSRAIIL